MHFVIDGTLWEGPGPDGYDRMVERILRGLSAMGHGFTFVGRGHAPQGGVLAPGLDWRVASEKISDRLTRDGWYKRSVPRLLGAASPMSSPGSSDAGGTRLGPGSSDSGGTRLGPGSPAAGGTRPWISWNGQDVGANVTQWLFLRGISDLLWPGPKGLSPEMDRKLNAWKEALGKPGTRLVTFSWGAAALLAERWGSPAGAGGDIPAGASGDTPPALPPNLLVLPAFYPADFSPATWEEKESTKTTHSGGQEYFLWTGVPGGGHWTEALKAFSLFKQSQRSQMRLLLAPWTEPGEGLLGSLETYKYRADVRVVRAREADWRDLFRSAYAGLYLPYSDELGWVPGVAAELQVPLISTWRSIGREWASEAALWVSPEFPDSIAEAMIGVYKDEGFRSRLLERARTLSETRKNESLMTQYEQVLTNGPLQ